VDNYFTSHAGPLETSYDKRWTKYSAGTYEVEVEPGASEVVVAMLNYNQKGIVPPVKVELYGKGRKWTLIQAAEPMAWENTNHDAFVDHAVFSEIPSDLKKMKIVFTVEKESYIYITRK
jgi:hypothetical protein